LTTGVRIPAGSSHRTYDSGPSPIGSWRAAVSPCRKISGYPIEESAGLPEEAVAESRDKLRAGGIEVICGNAGQRGLLRAANLAEAKCLISAIANPFESSNLLEKARRANPNINIIARAHSEAEVAHLETFGANHVVLGERDTARAMVNFLLATLDGEDAFEAPERGDRASA
jgi:voltage-gated potassium channel Kch